MADSTVILTNEAPAPIGPYSQGRKAGGFYFFSGQVPIDPKTNTVLQGTVQEQTHLVMKNIHALLKSQDLSFSSVVKTTIFIKNMNDFPEINKIYGEYFKEPYPARSTVEVARLPKDVLIEIEVIATQQ